MSTNVDENFRASLGERLREERQRLGLSQAELADSANLARRTQSAWERGEQAPGADFLRLAASLGMDVLYVITGERSTASTATERFMKPDEITLLADYRKADGNHQAAARLLLSAVAKACQS